MSDRVNEDVCAKHGVKHVDNICPNKTPLESVDDDRLCEFCQRLARMCAGSRSCTGALEASARREKEANG